MKTTKSTTITITYEELSKKLGIDNINSIEEGDNDDIFIHLEDKVEIDNGEC